LAAFLNGPLLQPLFQNPPRLLGFFAVLILIGALFFAYLIPNAETIATAHWLEASNALVNQITGLTLLAVLLLVAASIIKRTINPGGEEITTPSPTRPLIGIWGI